MRAVKQDIESKILGRPTFSIVDFPSGGDFAAFEADFIARHAPYYAYCKVPVEELAAIHTLEERGFRFIEVQFKSQLRMRVKYDTAALPYAYEPIVSQEALVEVEEIAGSTFTDDRFSIDPRLSAAAGSGRYRQFVRKSFESSAERADLLRNRETGEIVGFNTCRPVSESKVLLLLAGVKDAYKTTGLGAILNYFAFNDLYDRGYRTIVTHQSARNAAILNLELGHFGFRIVARYAVLRKIYGD
jgi:hypothetical protein